MKKRSKFGGGDFIPGEPPPGPEEARELAERVALGDLEARDRLIRSHLGLVGSVIREFEHLDVSVRVLFQAGVLGLCTAVDRYDPSLGLKFSTMAKPWIRQAVRREVAGNLGVMRIGSRSVARLKPYYQARRRLTASLGREPGFDEVAREMKLPAAAAAHLRRALKARAAPADEEVYLHLAAPAPPADRDDDQAALVPERLDRVRLLMAEVLNDRQRQVVSLRFGLQGRPLSLQDVGRLLKISRERVRQIEDRALDLLRRDAGTWRPTPLPTGESHEGPRQLP